MAVPSFLANGGDEYKMIPAQMKAYKNTGFLDNDLLVQYLNNHNPLQLPDSGRITVITGNSVLDSGTASIILAFDCIMFMLLPISLFFG